MAMNAKDFLAALEEIEAAKGISKETVLKALEEAMVRGFRKQLGGDDALVRVSIDPEKGTIDMCQIKNVVKDVQDDFLEISVEDAKAIDKKYKEGDEFIIPATIDDLRKATALSVKSILKQKFAEAEKDILYETFKDKINTMITGKVEQMDERGASVNIGRTSVYLPHKEMIGDERYPVGSTIKLFVSDVVTGTKGAHIVVSRSNEGFLKALFFEEISEIYGGTITIKSIAREAGERSKVAVYSEEPNVDPAGACIGQNGARIQKIVAQLGNGSSKEKIDIIAYSDIVGLYLMEALKPARVVGINVNEEEKSAVAVVKDDSLSLAIGRKGVNVRLAVRLTGYNIDIKTESEAAEEGFEYVSFEELQAQDMELKARAAFEKKTVSAASETSILPGLPEGYVAPQARHYDDETTSDLDEALMEASEKEEVKVTKTVKTVKEETPVEVVPTVKTEEPVKEETSEPVVKKTVRTTTSLSDLEKSLEEESKKNTKTVSKKKFNKKKEDEEEQEEVSSITKQDSSKFMSIYTDEEIREMEQEDNEEIIEDEEEVDYDEYDDYYDDEK